MAASSSIRTTGSKCTPQMEQGRHVFQILGYSRFKGMGSAMTSFIRSRSFAIGGHNWAIRFYPDGFGLLDEQETTDFVSVYLELLSYGASVRASCDLRLLDHTTGVSSSMHNTETREFRSHDMSRYAPHYADFMKRSKLEASPYLHDDSLVIECVVTVTKEPHVSETRLFREIDVPPSDIAEHIGRFLGEEEGKDVTFSVGGETFTAHSILLMMRSPVFRAELCGSMKEATTRHIAIEEMEPAVFRALLHFIYTDSLPDMYDCEEDCKNEMIRHLLVAADKYAMDRLKLICERIIYNSLGVETVADTLAFADQYNCEKLKDDCLEFMASSDVIVMDAVVATQGYKNLKKTCPSVLGDVFERRVKLRKI
ncbi:hypothetical protein E2562_032071 [Oryza meyeriana var. granulata]|uniref:BTB domain-containing protein n=1 Tax=Oryza meyeriana var. granulata TaxID=110450 RepID=A0A6G1CLF5_9ORYZ|nr:hypothetical protein E2562_032071 [Oryza meyeriana var. granulata]